MRVVITGGAGFLGSLVAERLLARGFFRGEEITSLVIADRIAPRYSAVAEDTRVEIVIGDVVETVPLLFSQPVSAVVHLASAVSAEVPG